MRRRGARDNLVGKTALSSLHARVALPSTCVELISTLIMAVVMIILPKAFSGLMVDFFTKLNFFMGMLVFVFIPMRIILGMMHVSRLTAWRVPERGTP